MKYVLESFIASAGILALGFVTIPLAGWAVGADVSMAQGAMMSGWFFLGRWVWFYYLRRYCSKLDKLENPTFTEVTKALMKDKKC